MKKIQRTLNRVEEHDQEFILKTSKIKKFSSLLGTLIILSLSGTSFRKQKFRVKLLEQLLVRNSKNLAKATTLLENSCTVLTITSSMIITPQFLSK